MEAYFSTEIEVIKSSSSNIERRIRIIALSRLGFQQIAYGLLEWISNQKPIPELRPNEQILTSLKTPADGSLVDAIESLLFCCERLGWSGCSRVLLRVIPPDRPAAELCQENQQNVIGLLHALVALRNDGAEGHGIIGGYNSAAEIDALIFLHDSLKHLIPARDDGNDDLYMGDERGRTKLRFLRSHNGAPILIRKIKVLASDRVRAYCQVHSAQDSRSDFSFDAQNPFQYLYGAQNPQLALWDNSWSPRCFIPDRLTDSFTGRTDKMRELVDWMNDLDSRTCLLFADGGLGKTTLVLEFIHRILDEEQDVEWKPEFVIFYTAKRWQWGLNGLEPIGAGRPSLMELLSHLYLLFFSSYPTNSFFRCDDLKQVTSQLQQKIMSELGCTRDDILIIIDNAETLIQSEEERASLGKEVREIAKRLGRVILTSRRREIIEAKPISVEPLSKVEALQFIRDRGHKLGIKSIRNVGDEDINCAVDKLERRPIVLEALIGKLINPSVRNIDEAAKSVVEMLRKDLGEFLFADAWIRLNPEVRKLLLLMSSFSDVHDSQSIKICAKIAGVSIQSAESALDESGGIASVLYIGGDPQVSFSKNFIEFSKKIFREKSSFVPKSEEIISARTQYSTFIKNAQKFTGDRIAQAFRTPQARAAHRARQQDKLDECRMLYEQAILTDSTNGWLFDRYAYFLFHDMHDKGAALHEAKKAVELLPDEGEPWYTRGLLEARFGDIRSCEISLNRAEQLGIDAARCSMQRCWAYLISKPTQLALAEKELRRLRVMIKDEPKGSRSWLEVNKLENRLLFRAKGIWQK
ncbi:MAG: tetratricopeptide repeat protein [Sulfobacillus sp.]